MFVIEPSELSAVAPLSRTSSQNRDAENRVPSATVVPAHSAVYEVYQSALTWNSGRHV